MKTINVTFFLTLLFTLAIIPCNAQKTMATKTTNFTQNSLLESELFARHNYSELSNINKKKKNLMKKIKQGNKTAEAELTSLSKKEKSTTESINISKSQSGKIRRVYKIGPIGPCPPRPPKSDGDCKLDGLRELIVDYRLKFINANVFTQNGKLIGTLKKKPFLVDKKAGIKAYKFEMKENYSGPVTLKVSRTSADGMKENYEQKLQL